MNTSEIRNQINQYLEHFSSKRLHLAAKFIAYLADKETEEATKEILDIPGFIEVFERGKKDIVEGRVVNWRTIRSDV